MVKRNMMGYPNGATNVAPDALPGAVRYVFVHGNGSDGKLAVVSAAANERFLVRSLRVSTSEVFQSLVALKISPNLPNDGDEADQLCSDYVWDQTYSAWYRASHEGGGAGLTVEPRTTLYVCSSSFANAGFIQDTSSAIWVVFGVVEDISRTL